jgi:hypothetical protein
LSAVGEGEERVKVVEVAATRRTGSGKRARGWRICGARTAEAAGGEVSRSAPSRKV